jgi:hypothetical protein
MSGITNPAEEYFKDGTWAWDPIGKVWKKLILDPVTDRLVIDHPGDIEVVQPVPNDLRVGNYGWDGSAWRKLPLVWGYSDNWLEKLVNSNADAGTNYLDSAVVPAGEVWILTNINAHAIQAGLSMITMGPLRGATSYYAFQKTSPGANEQVGGHCNIVLKAADKVRGAFTGCAAGDDIYLILSGYKMKIAE